MAIWADLPYELRANIFTFYFTDILPPGRHVALLMRGTDPVLEIDNRLAVEASEVSLIYQLMYGLPLQSVIDQQAGWSQGAG